MQTVSVATSPDPIEVSFSLATLARMEDEAGVGVVSLLRKIMADRITRPAGMTDEAFEDWLKTDEARAKIAARVDKISVREEIDWIALCSGRSTDTIATQLPTELLVVTANMLRSKFADAVTELIGGAKAKQESEPADPQSAG